MAHRVQTKHKYVLKMADVLESLKALSLSIPVCVKQVMLVMGLLV